MHVVQESSTSYLMPKLFFITRELFALKAYNEIVQYAHAVIEQRDTLRMIGGYQERICFGYTTPAYRHGPGYSRKRDEELLDNQLIKLHQLRLMYSLSKSRLDEAVDTWPLIHTCKTVYRW